MTRFLVLFAALGVVWIQEAVAQDVHIVSPSGYFIADGDDPAWAAPEFDHSRWRFQRDRRIDVPAGIQWIRAPIHIPASYIEENQPLSVIVGAMASNELYFNGVLVGTNGSPAATPAEEEPGLITARYYLPPSLVQPGENIIAVRLSSQQLQAFRGDIDMEIVISPYLDISHVRLVRHVPALILFGAIAASVILFGAMYFLHRRDRASLWIAMTFTFLAAQFGAEVYKGLVNYAYPVQLYRYLVIVFCAYGAVFSLLKATLWRLQAPRNTTLAAFGIAHGAAILSAAAVSTIEPKLTAIILSFLVVCLVLTLNGIRNNVRGSIPLAIGLLVVSLASVEGVTLFLDRGFFYGMTVLAAILFVLQAQDFRRSEMMADKAAAQSARMELELVKRHIQPHFMMNTLGALSEWIEENPSASVDMIQVLADEFRLLNDVSSKDKIPLSQEIELCDAHLQIMSYRQDQTLTLHKDIEDASQQIPPAIFHTLVENALTHNRYNEDKVSFLLRQRLHEDGSIQYELLVPMGAQKNAQKKQRGRGLGFTYIEARLEEAWPGAYQIEEGPTEDDIWRTSIVLGTGQRSA